MESEISHHGVKGMHWGVRKAADSSSGGGVSRKERKVEANKPNSGYSQRKRASDKNAYGAGGEKRINRRMNSGLTYKQAHRREVGRMLAGAALKSGVATTIVVLDLYGKSPMHVIAKRAETQRGRTAAANAMGLPRKATNGPTYSKKSRQGVHKITTL